MRKSKLIKTRFSKTKIKEVRSRLLDNVEDLFDQFGIAYLNNGERTSSTCPVHEGSDNETALSIFLDGGNWVCWTHHCEKKYGNDMLGLVRGILSNIEGDEVPFNKAVNWSCKFLNIQSRGVDTEYLKIIEGKSKFVNRVQSLELEPLQKDNLPSRDDVRDSLIIPARYYLDRGYSSSILDKFDVGLCLSKGRPMFGRAVVPVYDDDHEVMVGCVGRSTMDNFNPKWLFSKGFQKRFYLYNYWYAREHIAETRSAILVEGQGDVWRLEESGIYNSLGLFGCGMTDQQKIKLEKSGALNLFVIMDNDEAGKLAREKIEEDCKRSFNLYFPTIENKDVGDMSSQDIDLYLKPQLEC